MIKKLIILFACFMATWCNGEEFGEQVDDECSNFFKSIGENFFIGTSLYENVKKTVTGQTVSSVIHVAALFHNCDVLKICTSNKDCGSNGYCDRVANKTVTMLSYPAGPQICKCKVAETSTAPVAAKLSIHPRFPNISTFGDATATMFRLAYSYRSTSQFLRYETRQPNVTADHFMVLSMKRLSLAERFTATITAMGSLGDGYSTATPNFQNITIKFDKTILQTLASYYDLEEHLEQNLTDLLYTLPAPNDADSETTKKLHAQLGGQLREQAEFTLEMKNILNRAKEIKVDDHDLPNSWYLSP